MLRNHQDMLNNNMPWERALPLFPVILIAAFALLKFAFTDLYWSINREGNLIETAQAALCLATAIAASLVARGFYRNKLLVFASLYGLLSLLLLLVFMEEIRWGQDLLQLALPEYFRARNVQQELSFHNLDSTRAIVRQISLAGSFVMAFSWACVPKKIRSINPGLFQYISPDRQLVFYFLPFFLFYFYLTFLSGPFVYLTSINAFHVGYAGQDYAVHFIDQEPAELILFSGLLVFVLMMRHRQARLQNVSSQGGARLVTSMAFFVVIVIVLVHFLYNVIAEKFYPYDFVDFGTNAYSMGHIATAIDYYQKALMVDPLHSETHNNLGNVFMGQGRFKDAYVHLAEAVRIHPESSFKHYDLGLVLLKLDRFADARQSFMKTLQINPRYKEAYLGLADCYLSSKDVNSAVNVLKKYLATVREDVSLRNKLANILVNYGRYEEALEQYSKTLVTSPGYYGTHYNMGLVLSKLGHDKEAISHYNESLRLNPENAFAYNNLGNLLAATGNLNLARAHLARAIELKPDYVEAHLNLGVVFLKKGLPKLAVEQFSRALTVDPDNNQARKYMETTSQQIKGNAEPSL